MTRPTKKRLFPAVIVSSTVSATLISFVAAWLAVFPGLISMEVRQGDAKIEHVKPYKPSGRPFRLSPIPAGADWTRS